jgi:NAD(P)-dependent dehydrogenase (short-subunit alcohol dehydrogenase family)
MSKVWCITGAGSGLGTGIARAALRAGDRVVATGRNLEKVRKAYPDAAQENIVFVKLDVADETQAKAAVDEAVERFGRIDVLVNNAGYSLLGNFEQMTTAEIQQRFAPNFYGVVHGTSDRAGVVWRVLHVDWRVLLVTVLRTSVA